MPNWLWVALGGAAGSALRYGVANTVQRWSGGAWPLGTLSVNVIGSFVMGLIAALVLTRGFAPDPTRHLVIVGVLGGFTTFSAFSLETFQLFQNGHWGSAAANIAISVAGCVLATWAGFSITGRA
ncbi:MAG: fluoride efflux transporter CrcB [bacterium]|nr:fluoride efflux transporter CrcB [bacterium]